MPDGSTFPSATAKPVLTWRRPVWLWGLIAIALGAGWPLLFLNRESGLAQLAAVLVGAALLSAFGAIAVAYRIRRPPSSRGQVIAFVLAAMAFWALAAPFVYAGLAGPPAADGQEPAAGLEIAGVKPAMAWVIAPLALAVGAPTALAAGLVFSALCFRRRSPDVLVARQIPEGM
jgi:hypothetical protein